MSASVYERAIAVWGETAQLDMILEEIGELVVAIQQRKRGRITNDGVCEEIADVGIMLEQAAIMFGETSVEAYRRDKLARLEAKVSAAEDRLAAGMRP